VARGDHSPAMPAADPEPAGAAAGEGGSKTKATLTYGGGTIVTMRDVARATGVSQSTVSRVLSGAQTIVPIAADTRKRVLAAAERLGYRPNPLARGLRGSRTMLLGVIVREFLDPFFAGAVEAVSSEANRRGYNVVLGTAHARADEAIALWAVLEARHCDAIVLLGDMRDQPRLIEDLRSAHVPVVALWEGSRPSEIPSVSVDNRAGIDAVMDHLLDLGHRRIGFVGGRRLGDIAEREQAFVDAVARSGEPLRKGYVATTGNNPAGGRETLRTMLRLAEPPTAIVSATDVLAMGLLHEAYERGVRVPDNLSITGFDDIPLAAYAIPALTTVRMPIREMVAAAVAMVIDHGTTTREPGVGHPILNGTLVVRDSTAPPPGASTKS
jgi:DNA-binding LacI/PurR family transcriptional regulator